MTCPLNVTKILEKRYNPEVGDLVVGRITEVLTVASLRRATTNMYT